jgi:thiamine monophosphate synthase
MSSLLTTMEKSLKNKKKLQLRSINKNPDKKQQTNKKLLEICKKKGKKYEL